MDFSLHTDRDTETTLGGGTYKFDEADQMPHRPEDYSFSPYLLTMSYGKVEAEEVAARYITLCREAGEWVILDYNVLRRMVGKELMDELIQKGEVFSLIDMKMHRMGSNLDDWITQVIAVGLNNLKDCGFIEVIRRVDEEGHDCDLIKPTLRFFEPIERFVAVPA